jgi:ketosteroid isomerase-like protein
MAPDLRWVAAENSPYYCGAPYIGPQQVLENVFQKIASEWDRFQVVSDRFLDAGDSIIMEGRYRGTYKATGREANSQVVHIWVIRDGLLSEFRQYADTAQLRDVSARTAFGTTAAN